MSDRTVAELEQLLTGNGPTGPSPDLDLIRRRGRSRRRLRRVTAAGTAAAGATLVAVVAVAAGGGTQRAADPAESTTRPVSPAGLSDLARRALAEIPGAQQVSPSMVSIPAPGPRSFAAGLEAEVQDEPVELPEEGYAGVTSYERSGFPAWLYDATERAEVAEGSPDEGYPTGTTDLTGIGVDLGPRYLACARAQAPGEQSRGGHCGPAVVTRQGERWSYEWGMGTERFLEPGAPMEVFASDAVVDGHDGTLAIAGLDGVDVARAVFVGADGSRVEGTVLAGTLVPGESMFFGEVPGPLARVIAYDAAGAVIEDHPLRECKDPVDCEVR